MGNCTSGVGNIVPNNPFGDRASMAVYVEEHVRWHPNIRSRERRHEHERAAAQAAFYYAGRNLILAVIECVSIQCFENQFNAIIQRMCRP